MLVIGWVVFLVLLAQLFSVREAARINPNQRIASSEVDGVREIVLQRGRGGHYMLDAEVNGETVTFLLDTGASQLVFTVPQAERIGLRAGASYSVSTAAGTIRVRATEVAHLMMGNIELFDIPAAINPHMDGPALLGMSALANLEWTQIGDELRVRQRL
ncbi:MAG: TIGR02281 family clan AA aspartic protease [Cellvibrionales bacterium]|nr:TIGR02281 family clan AA aspartic protease [Cellvibrionales bacterium]